MTVMPPGPPQEPYGSTFGHPQPPQHVNHQHVANVPGRRHSTLWALIVIAIITASAGIAEGIVTLVRSAPPRINQSAQSSETTSAPPSEPTADRALCSAIAPVMADFDRFSKAYSRLGEPGTPARDAGIPKFVADSQHWISRIQPILDEHRESSPFLQRSLQRMIDDRSLLVADLEPGPPTPYAKKLRADETGSYSGPLHICFDLGVKW